MRIFMDMDGVAAVYEKSAYIAVGGEPALHLDTNKHYYRDAIPDERMIKVARMLKATPMAFITKVSADPTIAAVQLEDKRAWVDARDISCDAITKSHSPHIIGCMCTPDVPSKAEWMTKVLGCRPTATDILIDDFNDELHAWVRSGGTAIKYANGYSNKSDSWNGLTIEPETSPEDIFSMLMTITSGVDAIRYLTARENSLDGIKMRAYAGLLSGKLD